MTAVRPTPARPTDAAPVKVRRKLIEVSLPLDKINAAAAREKSIRHGHPSTLHLWWARRPLAAARAVILSQLVDDPSGYTDELLADPATRDRADRELRTRRELWEERRRNQAPPAEAGDVVAADPGPEPTLEDCAADLERERLFRLIEQLVLWENTTNGPLFAQARAEIRRSWRRTCADNRDHPRAAELFEPEKLPAFHDPFAGGGALPLEAQRLGLEAYASDLNPVAVLICKAMIEIPPRFATRPPVNPEARRSAGHSGSWKGAAGLAEDVRYYGQWMRNEAEKRIGHLYPKIEVTAQMAQERPDLKPYVGRKLTVIAWLWARTVRSPNPAFAQVEVPLASTFMLSTKAGKEAYVEPVIEGGGYRFTVKVGKPKDAEAAKNGTKLSQGSFRCLMSNTPFRYEYIDAEANAGRMGARLMAIVAEGDRGRVYLDPFPQHEAVARQAQPTWKPDAPSRGTWASNAQGRRYGFRTFGDYFTDRQLVALTTFSDLVGEAMARVKRDAIAAGLPDDEKPLRDGGTGATAYAEAVVVYLAFALNKVADRGSSLGRWDPTPTQSGIINTFSRQALPMTWDFAESNPLGDASGNYRGAVDLVAKALLAASLTAVSGYATQDDASAQVISTDKLVSTDPPYYDNIGYGDLSDFFYVWLRRSLKPVFPDLFATLAVPKAEELVATPYRHGSKKKAETFFLDSMTQAMHRLAEQAHPAFPVTIYYAFKQSETESAAGTSSTGWETFLDAVIHAGFAISGTWPMRTELGNRMIGSGTNALASSIVLVCRPRPADAPTATRRQFVSALKAELPPALAELQKANIAPVDLAQAAIGPGMAVYTRYANVIDAQGSAVLVRAALALVNQVLDETLAEQEGDFDADSRFALAWFDQQGFTEGDYGIADVLARAKNTSVKGMEDAGILVSRHGKVRLLRPDELDPDWDPATDRRRPVWQSVHQLVLAARRSEEAVADLIPKLGPEADVARELAYRLYVLCHRKKRSEEAGWYNGLVQSWAEVSRLAAATPASRPVQGQLFGEA
jgi:putative DNA methylase